MLFDAELWAVVISNALTPIIGVTFPWRITATLAASVNHHWLLVSILANIAGSLGMLPHYYWWRKHLNPNWTDQLQSRPIVYRLVNQLRSHPNWLMFAINVIPVPDPVVSLIGGSERYPLGKFLLICQVNKILHILPLTLGAVVFHQRVAVWRHWLYHHQYLVWLAVLLAIVWWLFHRPRQSSDHPAAH